MKKLQDNPWLKYKIEKFQENKVEGSNKADEEMNAQQKDDQSQEGDLEL